MLTTMLPSNAELEAWNHVSYRCRAHGVGRNLKWNTSKATVFQGSTIMNLMECIEYC